VQVLENALITWVLVSVNPILQLV